MEPWHRTTSFSFSWPRPSPFSVEALRLQAGCPDLLKGFSKRKYWEQGGIKGFGQDGRGSPGSAPEDSTRRAFPLEWWMKWRVFQCLSLSRIAGNGSTANPLFENYLPAIEIPQQLSLIQIKSSACVPSNFSSVGPAAII